LHKAHQKVQCQSAGWQRRHSKTCAAVFERSLWSAVARTQPCGLGNKDLKFEDAGRK